MSLCSWVRAVETYHKVLQEVKPKRLALKIAEAKLEDTLQKLKAKKEQLKDLNERIRRLMDSYEVAMAKKKDLENQVTICELQSDRAKKLIGNKVANHKTYILGGLSGEKQRWTEAAKAIELSNHTLIGDVLLSAGVMAYLGAFTGAYRIRSLSNWCALLRSNDLPFSNDYSLAKTFSDPTIIRNWQVEGLPADRISIESAIIINRSSRWPLIIDTQGQALNWIKNLENKRKLIVTNFRDADFMRKLENAVRFGIPAVFPLFLFFSHNSSLLRT
jgi:dynein heavy chain